MFVEEIAPQRDQVVEKAVQRLLRMARHLRTCAQRGHDHVGDRHELVGPMVVVVRECPGAEKRRTLAVVVGRVPNPALPVEHLVRGKVDRWCLLHVDHARRLLGLNERLHRHAIGHMDESRHRWIAAQPLEDFEDRARVIV